MTIELVSVSTAGGVGMFGSVISPGGVSADGRYVAFFSSAPNLVAGDTNVANDVFVRDTVAGTTTRISVDGVGAQGDGSSYSASISADGRYVAFASDAVNLVADDTNGIRDVFVRDTVAGTTTRLSVDGAGAQGNSTSYNPSISADGRYVAFYSNASNLVAGDTNGATDVFVRDTVAGTTTRISVDGAGAQANSGSSAASISADGRYVAFSSDATNLVVGDTNGNSDVFVRDTVVGTTTRLSVDGTGVQGNGYSSNPSISADGRYVAFSSNATNLVVGDTNGASDVFVRDTVAGTTTRLTIDGTGVQGNGYSYNPSISADGRYVALSSDATNLVVGDTNGASDVFVRDTVAGTTTRLTIDGTGVQGNGYSYNPSISADGRYIGFYTLASNFTASDTNGTYDVFLASNPLLSSDALIRVLSPGVPNIQSTTLSSSPVAPNVASNFAWTGSGAAPAVVSAPSFYPPTHTLAGINDGVYGNSSSYLHSAPFWVKIDLGTGRVFDQVSLGRDRTGFFNDRDPGQFRVYVSANEAVYANGDATNDTSEYTLVYDSGVNGYSGLVNFAETVIAQFAPVLGRYVKIEFYAGSGFLEPAIDEIQVRRSYELIGDDTFIANAQTLVSGTVLDGFIGNDTLRIEGGGTVDLTSGVTLTSIEQIELAGPGNTTAIVTAAQAALITSAAGAKDVVQIASGSASEALVADLILNAGVERVEWSIPGFASAVEAVPDGSGGFIISYDDGDDLKPWDTIDAQYDSLGRKVSQTNDYDFPGPEGGITLNFTYDPVTGFATTIVNTDGHLTRTFSTITTTLENGVVTKVDTINDNNTASNADDTLVEQFFTAGVITLERTTDTSSGNAGKPWLYIDREYDGGVTQIFRTFWDAGVNGGGQQVVGTAGSQVIEGVVAGGGVSTTDDALVGGAGADTFRFVPGFGHDTIYDFADGTDLLDLSSYAAGIDTLAELQNAASITQVAFGAGFNTVIAFNGTSDQITIRNFTVAQLGDADFAV